VSFERKVAVVTGAASGIGLALTDALTKAGAHVVMADIDPERLNMAVATVEPGGDSELLPIATDVSRYESVEALAATARDRFGAVHLLFNNAGVQRPGRIWNVPPADFRWLLEVNLLGAFNGIRAFVPAMIERGEPAHVVNTASISGVLGFARIGAYAATKYGVVGLSESLLHDLREKGAPIGVSVLCPGAVATGLGANSAALRGTDGADAQPPQGTAPITIAEMVLDAVKANRFWILTHPGYNGLLAERTAWMLGERDAVDAPGFAL
jgi:NAD(P)-dependent dehydrogenase (short-subunit alcohol dehydrogenase family)